MASRKKRPAKRPAVGASIATMARALVEADQTTDAVAAERFGVSVSTIKAWRGRSDPELIEAVQRERHASLDAWRVEAAATMIAIAREMRRIVSGGAEIPMPLIAAARVLGAMNVEAGALLERVDPGADPSERPAEVRH